MPITLYIKLFIYKFKAQKALKSYYNIVQEIAPEMERRDINKIEKVHPRIAAFRIRGRQYVKKARDIKKKIVREGMFD